MYENLLETLRRNDIPAIRSTLNEMNIVDIAHFLDTLEQHQLIRLFRILPKDTAVGVFAYFSTESQQQIVEAITDNEIRDIVDELFLDDAVDFIEEMPANIVKKVLKNTNPELRKQINQFLNYPADSAGTVMTIEFIDLVKNMTVQEAIQLIKRTGIDKETINHCYVIDDYRRLEGVVSIRKLILNPESSKISEVYTEDVISCVTTDDQEHVAHLFKKYDLTTLPVVDHENRLVGIITIDDIVDIIDQENTEDMQRMAAIVPTHEEYLRTSVLTLARHRLLWLLILMISATFTGQIIQRYDRLLQSSVILASFIPMLMDTGGNSGSQASSMVIRGLALGEIQVKDFLRIFWKEFRVSLLVGLILAVVNLLRIHYLEGFEFNIALTVAITTFLTVILAKIVGGLLPILAKSLRIDPAMMASPMLTTIVDAVALIIYFTIAGYLLGI